MIPMVIPDYVDLYYVDQLPLWSSLLRKPTLQKAHPLKKPIL
ncbi:hypothetical protein GGP77_000592 [Salinibacter ruber]|uniref:Uncharacterized protein n=1 Tax=Salinibacter ruber TaxID=146919 RepID=A0A9X2ZTK4_9BACT|nr:hypothetical protein [Salinibacter ruber]MCS3639169.1 hypothetical protein [Salinibacter ruber]MCS3658377.1 hypothetical protein [Salinibacter ruber]MCS3666387.1 hypothetical protein [Salinibacter ruber]MCS3715272.1 hypothetical protein [Salinibacter ruber]